MNLINIIFDSFKINYIIDKIKSNITGSWIPISRLTYTSHINDIVVLRIYFKFTLIHSNPTIAPVIITKGYMSMSYEQNICVHYKRLYKFYIAWVKYISKSCFRLWATVCK